MSNLPEVRPDQVWADNDPRSQPRKVKVVEVTATHAVVVTVEAARGAIPVPGRRTRIRLDRFNPNRMTGYTLLGEEDSA